MLSLAMLQVDVARRHIQKITVANNFELSTLIGNEEEKEKENGLKQVQSIC